MRCAVSASATSGFANLDAEKVGEMLVDVATGLPETDNFQHWPPWRSLVVETARQLGLHRRHVSGTDHGAGAAVP
jgi:hypothetical protein